MSADRGPLACRHHEHERTDGLSGTLPVPGVRGSIKNHNIDRGCTFFFSDYILYLSPLDKVWGWRGLEDVEKRHTPQSQGQEVVRCWNCKRKEETRKRDVFVQFFTLRVCRRSLDRFSHTTGTRALVL